MLLLLLVSRALTEVFVLASVHDRARAAGFQFFLPEHLIVLIFNKSIRKKPLLLNYHMLT